MAPKKLDLMYWRSASGVRPELIRSLEAEGYVIKVANKLEDILDFLQRRPLAAVLVDASDSESETIQRATELSSTERLFKTPLFFMGSPAKDVTPQLGKQFVKLVATRGAVELSEILSQLDLVCQGKTRSQISESTSSFERPDSSSTSFGKTTAQLKLDLAPHLNPTRLHSSYGGSVFAFATRPGIFDDEILVPKHPKRSEIIRLLGEITRSNRALGTHARRVCYLGGALANGAGFNSRQDEVIRTSSLLLNLSAQRSSRLLNIDFLYDEIEEYAEQLASSFDNAADMVQQTLEDANISRTIRLIADILRRKEMFDSAEQILSSQCVLLAEIAGRACWKNATWSANGAHRVIRELRHETRYALDRSLTAAMCRILNESSCMRHAVEAPTAKPPSEQEEVNKLLTAEAHTEAQQLFTNIVQEEVDIAEIKSGMRLSLPIVTSDGRLVVRSNVRLDEQMIWSLWQLVAVAPVERKVKIVKEAYVPVEEESSST